MSVKDLFIDVSALPENGYGLFQLLSLGGVYAYLLCLGSAYISDGSELLLLVPSFAGLVGSVVIPVLGAVPDGFIVLFSGLGVNAAVELNVGVGVLAGSTVMVLTFPWFLSILGGRVLLVNGEADYLHKTENKDDQALRTWCSIDALMRTGVSVSEQVKHSADIMMYTTMAYVLTMAYSVMYMGDPVTEVPGIGEVVSAHELKNEHIRVRHQVWFVVISAIFCVVALVWYLRAQLHQCDNEEHPVVLKRDKVIRDAIKAGKISLLGLIAFEFQEYREAYMALLHCDTNTSTTVASATQSDRGPNRDSSGLAATETTPLTATSVPVGSAHMNVLETIADNPTLNRLSYLLRPYFQKYDVGNTGYLDMSELSGVFKDLGETSLTPSVLVNIFSKFDVNGDQKIDFEEFIKGTVEYVWNHEQLTRAFNNTDDDGSYSSGGSNSNSHGQQGQSRNQSHRLGCKKKSSVLEAIESAHMSYQKTQVEMTGSRRTDNVNRHTPGAATSISGAVGSGDVESGLDNMLETVSDLGTADGCSETDSEEEEIPEDLLSLSPTQQQKQIKSRAFLMMAFGTLICLIISDPMVDVFSELARRLGVSSFYVTFLLAPLSSNATELIAAYNYAKKKTSKSITISMSTLLGAACLNNTFSLGIFLFIVYWKSIVLDYFAEFTAIVFVQCVLWYLCQTRRVFSLFDGCFVLSLFPLSLGVVSILHSYGWK